MRLSYLRAFGSQAILLKIHQNVTLSDLARKSRIPECLDFGNDVRGQSKAENVGDLRECVQE